MVNESNNINKTIIVCLIIDVLILSYGHTVNINILILIGIIGFYAIVLFSPKSFFLPIMLFFLPWSPIMKLNHGDFTFYTIIVLIFFILLFLSKEYKERKGIMEVGNLLLVFIFIIYTLILKLLLNQNFSMSYVMFVFMLFFLPIYLRLYRDQLSFEFCIISFSLGIISAGFISKILMKYPHMLEYIDVYEWKRVGLTRLSGFYGDANFYSSHIIVAICGLLIISMKKELKHAIALYVLIISLIYLGLLSVSKMFLFVLIIVSFLWMLTILLNKENILLKIRIIFCVAISVIFIISTGVFADQIHMYMIRFDMVNDTNSLTTGRSTILENYLSFFENNPLALFFGQGYSSVYSSKLNFAAHNTLIQSLYQFGIIGSMILAIWLFQLNNMIRTKSINILSILFAIACFIPWLSLDILFFDEFFYINALYLVGIVYFERRNNNDRKKEVD